MLKSRLAKRLLRASLVVPLALLLILFLVIPLITVVSASLTGSSSIFSNYARLFTQGNGVRILLNTLKIATLAAVISVTAAYPVAYYMTTIKGRLLAFISASILVPLFTAFLIRTYAWMVILGREGLINKTLLSLNIIDRPLTLLNTTFAVVIGMVHVFIPMALFTMYSSMAKINPEFVRAAQVLGANPVQAFCRIYFPTSRPAILSAGVLIFIVSLGFYITPAMLGGPGDMMFAQLVVIQMTTLLDFDLAYASSVVLLLATLIVLAIAGMVLPLESIWSPGTEIHVHRPKRAERLSETVASRGKARLLRMVEAIGYYCFRRCSTRKGVLLKIYATLIIVFLLAPLAVIVALSFSSSSFITFPPPGFSLRWWTALASATDWHRSFLASIFVGVIAALLSTAIGSMGAFWLVRTNPRLRRGLFLLALSPLMVPVVIIAGALYIFEARIGILGTFPGLIVGHVLLGSPYVVIVMATALRVFDVNLEHAAAIHGAKPAQIVRLVTIPILKPALLTGFLFAFLSSFDELLVSVFLVGRHTSTLPIKFWGDIRYQVNPLLSAAATFIVVTVIATIALAGWIRSRHSSKSPLAEALHVD